MGKKRKRYARHKGRVLDPAAAQIMGPRTNADGKPLPQMVRVLATEFTEAQAETFGKRAYTTFPDKQPGAAGALLDKVASAPGAVKWRALDDSARIESVFAGPFAVVIVRGTRAARHAFTAACREIGVDYGRGHCKACCGADKPTAACLACLGTGKGELDDSPESGWRVRQRFGEERRFNPHTKRWEVSYQALAVEVRGSEEAQRRLTCCPAVEGMYTGSAVHIPVKGFGAGTEARRRPPQLAPDEVGKGITRFTLFRHEEADGIWREVGTFDKVEGAVRAAVNKAPPDKPKLRTWYLCEVSYAGGGAHKEFTFRAGDQPPAWRQLTADEKTAAREERESRPSAPERWDFPARSELEKWVRANIPGVKVD